MTSSNTAPLEPNMPEEDATVEAHHSDHLDPEIAARLKRDDAGLIAAIVQDDVTGEVLMLGWMNDEALRRTLTEGRVTFWSRSRAEFWRKGDTSGHAQYVRSVALDCDGDALLVRVEQVGAACHTGARSCFFTSLPAVTGSAPGPSATPSTGTPSTGAASMQSPATRDIPDAPATFSMSESNGKDSA